MIMKKLFAILLAVLILTTMAACADNTAVDQPKENGEKTNSPVRVMVLNGTTGFGMANLMGAAANDQAEQTYEFSVETDASNVVAGLVNKSALADYFATITATNFVRYQYTNKDGALYIPLKVYEDIYSDVAFKRHGLKYLPIYTSGRRLCHNSCFVAFDSKQFSSFHFLYQLL